MEEFDPTKHNPNERLEKAADWLLESKLTDKELLKKAESACKKFRVNVPDLLKVYFGR